VQRPWCVWLLVVLMGCATAPPTEEEQLPPAEVLYQQGLTLLAGSRLLGVFHRVNYSTAIETFQRIIDNYPYSDHAVLSELKIADAYFEQERYDEALSYYRDFTDLHPQHERVPYTILRAALCQQRQVKTSSRDQTATRQALSFLDVLLTKYPHSPEAQEGEVLWRELRTRLARHEIAIADFYLTREEFQAAADRYRSVLNRYPGLGLDAEALYKLGVCYSKLQLDDEAQKVFEVILQNYRGTEIAESASHWVPAAN